MSVTRKEILNHVKEVLEKEVCLDQDELDGVTEDSMLVRDLDLDDMDCSTVLLRLEERLGINILDKEVVDSRTTGRMDISVSNLLDVIVQKAGNLVEATFELINRIEAIEKEAEPLRKQLDGLNRRRAAFVSDFSLNMMEEDFTDAMFLSLIKRLRETGKNPEQCSAYSIELMRHVNVRGLSKFNEEIAWLEERMNHYNLLTVAANSKTERITGSDSEQQEHDELSDPGGPGLPEVPVDYDAE